jgi:hypothetical protein
VSAHRDEPCLVRIHDNGDIVIPGEFIRRLLEDHNANDASGLAEDLEDFGPGRCVVVMTAGSDSGTEITIERDRQKGTKPV